MILRLWLFLVLTLAGALAPSRASARVAETRTWDFFAMTAESRPENQPQVADCHQANPLFNYETASGYAQAAESVTWRNGYRTADGKFASPLGPERSGAAAEQSVWDAVRQKPGWSVVEGRVTVRNAAGDLRVYDGAAIRFFRFLSGLSH